VAFKEAMTPEFKEYQNQIVRNARALAEALIEQGFSLVSGGTDNHLMLIDLTNKDITGKDAEAYLDDAWITVNKNTIPFETRSPFVTSGIRIGTPALTTRGMGENEMRLVASCIARVIEAKGDPGVIEKVRGEVGQLTARYPIYQEM
ncbi:MAG: serine hydroxymethyltransferase, partial [Desulfomonilia bacterium]|nr:serine hydroxymethyltransferase [Desulfomonilia bacterium]